MPQQLLLELVFNLARIAIAVVFSVVSLYISIRFLDRLTRNIDEWQEIKKGNLAVSIFFISAIIAILFLVEPSISNVLGFVKPDMNLFGLVISFLVYVIIFILAMIVVYLTIHMIDHLTQDLDEMAELKKGNLAVGLLLSVVLLCVAFVVRTQFVNLIKFL